MASYPLTAQEKPEAAPPKVEDLKGDPAKLLPVGVDPKTFVLGAEDVVSVRVWRENDLTSTMAIRPDGKITMPLIGEVQAGGLTPEQLGQKLAQQLEQFIKHPEVMVSVMSVRSQKYYISGQVGRNGAFPLSTPTTVLQALTMAGGLKDFAAKGKITVMRGAARLKFNYNEVIKGKNPGQNVLLQNGDHIIVP